MQYAHIHPSQQLFVAAPQAETNQLLIFTFLCIVVHGAILQTSNGKT